jgi:hypothetical protein
LDGKRAAAGIKRVDNEERKPRTIDEMKEEAYRLRPFFDQFEE